MSRLIFLLVTVQIHRVINIPLSSNEKQTQHINTSPNHIVATINSNREDKKVPVLVPLVTSQHVALVDSKLPNARKKKGQNIPLSLPLTHQLLVPSNLHVIPIHSNNYHSTIHTGVNIINDHVNLPIVSHTYSHSSSNVSHPAPLYLIPFHTHLVPLHDLTVIPLHRPIHNVNLEPKLSHYRSAMDKRGNNEEEPINRFRYFGGYGNGLNIGGHGAGHGFYAVGSWA